MMLRNQIDTVAGAMSRRDWLVRSANGFGGLALFAMFPTQRLGRLRPHPARQIHWGYEHRTIRRRSSRSSSCSWMVGPRRWTPLIPSPG